MIFSLHGLRFWHSPVKRQPVCICQVLGLIPTPPISSYNAQFFQFHVQLITYYDHIKYITKTSSLLSSFKMFSTCYNSVLWIDLLLDRLDQARVFNRLDLAQGYHQVAMAKDSVEKTPFWTNLGQWEYLVMLFELCNTSNTFQRLMNAIFEKETNSFVLVYLDDILIYSCSIGEHWDHLKIAL